MSGLIQGNKLLPGDRAILTSFINLTTATKCFNSSSPPRHELATMLDRIEYEAQKLLPPYIRTYQTISNFAGMRVDHRDPIWNTV